MSQFSLGQEIAKQPSPGQIHSCLYPSTVTFHFEFADPLELLSLKYRCMGEGIMTSSRQF